MVPPRRTSGLRVVALLLVCALLVACASSQPAQDVERTRPSAASTDLRERAAHHAAAVLGAPYRYGGGTPKGFDCSGLVVWSYAMAGLEGLPHSTRQLGRRARTIPRSELRPGDLLFFELGGSKPSHVGIYAGDDAFIHAPSSGKRVERVRLDHVYWRDRVARAGRITL